MAMQVNLLPAEFHPKPKVRMWPIVLAVVLMLNLLVTGTYWLTLHLELGSVRTQIQSQENENASLKRAIEEAQWKEELQVSVKRKTEYISQTLTDSVLWSPALAVIEDSLIPGVTITGISFSGEGIIGLNAMVDSIKTAVDFWASLQARTGLDGIWLTNAPAGGSISISMRGWSGWEADDNED